MKKLSEVKIEEFAEQIGLPVERLIDQLDNSGIHSKTSSDVLSDSEKKQLLMHLQKAAIDAKEVIRPRPVQIEIRRKKRKENKLEIELINAARLAAKRNTIIEDINKARKTISTEKNKISDLKSNLAEITEEERKLNAVINSQIETETTTPKVFISYSYDSTDHKGWVEKLAKDLVSNGVPTMLDKWSLHPGDPITEFMERGIKECQFVLIICTEKYKTKSDKRLGGVGYEEAIISSDMFTNQNHRKYIPILKAETSETAIPTTLHSKSFINMFNDAEYDSELRDLLLTIFGRRPEAPPLGKRPKFLT